MDRLEEARTRARAGLRGAADLVYRHSLTFSFAGVTSPHVTRCSIKDPRQIDFSTARSAEAGAARLGVPFADLRLVKVHPDDDLPHPGSRVPWDGGELEILEWAQASDFTLTSLGLGVIRR